MDNITFDELEELVEYSPSRGRFIYKVTRGKYTKGTVAGGVQISTGYHITTINDVAYRTHRLVWFYHNKVWPRIVDHIDGNKLNNKIENLRVACHSKNAANRGKLSTNTSGYKGVYYRKDNKKYRVMIMVDGVFIRVGQYNSPEEAADAYDRAAIEHFGEFALTNKMIRERNLES